MKSARCSLIALLIGLATFNAIDVNAGTVVCRLSGIGGFEGEQTKGKEAIGKTTTRTMGELKVYLVYSQNHLFVLSNFVSKGADYQTKISTDEGVDLLTIVSNLVFTEEPTEKEGEQFAEALPKIKFVVDPSIGQSKYKGLVKEIKDLSR